jgi:hypothetical protein
MKVYGRIFGFPLLVVLVLCVSACGPVIGTGGSSLTPAQVLQNSSKAMAQLKSMHTDLNITTNLLANALSAPITPTPVPGQVNFFITGHGDENLPGQQSLQISIDQNVSGQHANFAEMVLGNKVYIQNARSQWFVLDKSVVEGTIGGPFNGINLNPFNLLTLLQNANITDFGTVLLNGQQVRHLSASLNKAGLEQLITSNPQLSKLLGQRNIIAVIDHAKTTQAGIDLWIDETNFYVHRAELKFDLGEALSSATATPTLVSSLAAHFDSVIDLSKFDQPVTITPPANAIPTNNLAGIFSLAG